MNSLRIDRAMIVLLLAGIALRFVGLLTPLSGLMSERQADTAAITRNLIEEEANPLLPRIDWRGRTEGHVETELQMYTAAAAALAALTQIPCETTGRLLSIACFLASVFFFHRLVAKRAGSRTALIGSALLAFFPAYAYFSRVMMPDSLALALAMACIYHFDAWIDEPRPARLWLWAALLAFAVAVKPYMAQIALPIAFAYVRKRRNATLPLLVPLCACFLALFAVAAYYAHAHALFLRTGLTFGIFEAGGGKWLNPADWSPAFFRKLLVTRLFLQHMNWALAAAAIGVVATWRQERSALFRSWLLAVAAYFLVVNRGNFIHIHYQLPAVFTIAYFAAEGLAALLRSASRVRRAAAPALLALFVGTSLVATSLLFLTERMPAVDLLRLFPAQLRSFASIDPELFAARELAAIGGMAGRRVPRGDRMIVAGKTAPALLYAADRKGWREDVASLTDSLLAERRAAGTRWLLVNARGADAAAAWREARRRLPSLAPIADTLGVYLCRLP